MIRIRRVLSSLVISAAAVAASVFVSQPAAAQGGAPMFGDAFNADVSRRDVPFFVEELQLDDAQRYVFETLFDDYQQSFTTGIDGLKKELSEAINNVPPGDPQRAMEYVFRPVERWHVQKQAIYRQLMEDLKGQMSEHQLSLWPGFERKFNRIRFMSKGRLSGESVDLVVVLKGLDIDRRTREVIAPVVEEYEIALDDAIIKRNLAERNAEGSQMLMINQQGDGKEFITASTTLIDRRVTVRDINDAYTDRIAEGLPSQIASQFRKAALERGYSRAFILTQAQRVLSAAKELDGLDGVTLDAIYQLERGYLEELEKANLAMVKGMRDTEPKEMKNRIPMQVEAFKNKPVTGGAAIAEDPVRSLQVKRDLLGQPVFDRLQQLLTPEQYALLPGMSRVEGQHNALQGSGGPDSGRHDGGGKQKGQPQGDGINN